LSCIIVSCRPDDNVKIETATVSFTQSEYNVLIGDSLVVNPVFSNEAVSKKKFNWSISNSKIATINIDADNSCTVTGISSGVVKVSIESEDHLIAANFSILVNHPAIHTVLWIGTSIPAGCTYPINSCENLGYKCINNSIGSSGICLNQGFLGNGRDGRDLSEKIAEKKARYKDYVSAKTLEDYYNMSYERVVLPYLDQVEVIVFDHGFNDRGPIESTIGANIDWNSLDRTTYIGAFNYLIKEILIRKPSMRIIIGGYFENLSDKTVRGGKVLCQMQETIANHYGYPLLDVWNYAGITYDFVPNTSNYIKSFNAKYGTNYENWIVDQDQNITYFQLFCPDTVHPSSDKTGSADLKLDDVYKNLLRKALSTN
jgi:hypothetical protein